MSTSIVSLLGNVFSKLSTDEEPLKVGRTFFCSGVRKIGFGFAVGAGVEAALPKKAIRLFCFFPPPLSALFLGAIWLRREVSGRILSGSLTEKRVILHCLRQRG